MEDRRAVAEMSFRWLRQVAGFTLWLVRAVVSAAGKSWQGWAVGSECVYRARRQEVQTLRTRFKLHKFKHSVLMTADKHYFLHRWCTHDILSGSQLPDRRKKGCSCRELRQLWFRTVEVNFPPIKDTGSHFGSLFWVQFIAGSSPDRSCWQELTTVLIPKNKLAVR